MKTTNKKYLLIWIISGILSLGTLGIISPSYAVSSANNPDKNPVSTNRHQFPIAHSRAKNTATQKLNATTINSDSPKFCHADPNTGISADPGKDVSVCGKK